MSSRKWIICIPEDFPMHIPEIEREYRQSSWMLWTFSVIRIIVIEVNMVFGLCPGMWAGCLGPWNCGNMFNTPFLDKPRVAKEKMWCRTGIQRTWASVPAMLLYLLWEFGKSLPFSVRRQVCLQVLGSKSCGWFFGEQSLSAPIALSDVWMLLWPVAVARWVSQHLKDHEY